MKRILSLTIAFVLFGDMAAQKSPSSKGVMSEQLSAVQDRVLNQIENFIPSEKYDRIIEKNMESDMDYAKSVFSDSYQVQLIRDSFEELGNLNFTVIPDEYFNRLEEIFLEKVERESQQENTDIDYDHNDQRKDIQDIKDLFSSFEK